MKKIILSVFTIVSLIIPASLGYMSGSALACGEKPPETLLSLYRNSETIHIGTFRKLDEGKPRKEEGDADADYTLVDIKRHFDVSSTLKGESAKFVTIPDIRYVYEQTFAGYETIEEAVKDQNPDHAKSEEDEEAGSEEESGQVELNAGDHVLVFLRKNSETKQIELTDYVDGLKKLSPADIAVYEARIKEIGSILAAKKPDPAKIVDWLVRLTEDPVTRWEGAYELEQSFFAQEFKKTLDEEREKSENGSVAYVGEGDRGSVTDDGFETGRTTLFARLLTDRHKQALSNLLMDKQFHGGRVKKDESELNSGDRELMNLVARWADERVAGVFVDKLRNGGYSVYDNAGLMTRIGAILGDKNLSEIAEAFEENSYHEDDEKVEAEGETVSEKKEGGADETSTGDKPKVDAKPAKASKKPALTYKRLRADLTAKFLTRADAVMKTKMTAAN